VARRHGVITPQRRDALPSRLTTKSQHYGRMLHAVTCFCYITNTYFLRRLKRPCTGLHVSKHIAHISGKSD